MIKREDKNISENVDAVSPVIGVILMVAITVILAAVIGTTVLGLSDQSEPAENAVIEVLDVEKGPSGSPDEVTVQLLTVGDVANDELYLGFKDTQIQHEGGSSYAGPDDLVSWRDLSKDPGAPPRQALTAGDTVMFEPPDSPLSNEKVEGREVVVVYKGEDTETIVYETGPLPGP